MGSRSRTHEERREEYLRAKAKRALKKQKAPVKSAAQRKREIRKAQTKRVEKRKKKEARQSQTNEESAAELQRKKNLRESQTNEERAAELQRKKNLRESQTNEERAAELQRKKNLRESQTNEESAAELQRKKNLRESQTNEERAAELQRKKNLRESRTNEERAAELQRKKNLRKSQTNEESAAELQRKKMLRESQTNEKRAAELQRMKNLRESRTNEERAAELQRKKKLRESQDKAAEAQIKYEARKAARRKRFSEVATQLSQLVTESDNTTVQEPEQAVDVNALERFFWSSSGLDKSGIELSEACSRGGDVDEYMHETYENTVYACAACGCIGVGDAEEFTVFRKDVVDTFCEESQDQKTPRDCYERGVKTQVDGKYYILMLIKALVGARACLKDGHFMLCSGCAKCVAAKTKRELWSLDLGDVSNLPKLTAVEKAAIAATRVYGTVIKIKHTVVAETQPQMIRGHFICFPQNAAEKMAECVFPRTDIQTTIQIHFIGSKAGWEKMQPLLASCGGVLEVRPDVVRAWLTFLKQTNKYYADIKIDFSENRFAELQRATKKIVEEAAAMFDTTVDDTIGTTVGKNEDAAQPETGMPAVVVEGQGNIRRADEAVKDFVRIVLAKETGNAINEFERNEELFATAFPWVFATGQIPAAGNLKEAERRCLLLRYDHRVEREPALIFLMYNQLQRHGFSYNVAHADNTIAQRLNELVSSPKFEEEVTNALSSNGKEGSELRSFILKAINIGQGVTPFSKGESRMFYTKLLAEVRFRGSPSVWLTMSPSAVDNSLCLRMCFGPQYKENEEYACRSSCVLESPAMTALFFKFVTQNIEDRLLRIPRKERRKTKPAFNQQPAGVFGRCSAYCRAVESQSRTLLHFHALLWTELSPEIIQQAIKLNDENMGEIIKFFDACVTTRMPSEFWKFSDEKAWEKCERLTPPSLSRNGKTEDPERDRFINTSNTQLHRRHKFVCFETTSNVQRVPRCRFGFPQNYWLDSTCPAQLSLVTEATKNGERELVDISKQVNTAEMQCTHAWKCDCTCKEDISKKASGHPVIIVSSRPTKGDTIVADFTPELLRATSSNSSTTVFSTVSQTSSVIAYVIKYATKHKTTLAQALTSYVSAKKKLSGRISNNRKDFLEQVGERCCSNHRDACDNCCLDTHGRPCLLQLR